jgi:multiple sugar transport system permease protein
LVFYGLPFLLVVWYSLFQGGRFAALDTYIRLLENEVFRIALKNTFGFLAVGLLLILTISYAIALLLRDPVRRSSSLQSVVLLPFVMPVVGTVVLVDALFAETGLWSKIYMALGLPVAGWLRSDSAFWIAVGLYLWKNTGYSVLLFLSGLATIPPEQYDAAELDGAKPRQKFCHITAPQMWYSVFFAGVFSLLNAFKSFREIFLIGGSHPHHSIYMLQHFINNSYAKMGYSKMAGASILLVALLCILFGICYRLVLRKEAYKE